MTACSLRAAKTRLHHRLRRTCWTRRLARALRVAARAAGVHSQWQLQAALPGAGRRTWRERRARAYAQCASPLLRARRAVRRAMPESEQSVPKASCQYTHRAAGRIARREAAQQRAQRTHGCRTQQSRRSAQEVAPGSTACSLRHHSAPLARCAALPWRTPWRACSSAWAAPPRAPRSAAARCVSDASPRSRASLTRRAPFSPRRASASRRAGAPAARRLR